MERGVDKADLAVRIAPPGWVADGRVDVREGDREVDDVEVKVLEAPVLELLLADRSNSFLGATQAEATGEGVR